ncbi:MAG: hypothetical protein LBH80_00115 [Prevotellaceae bacterium]|jgi:hypothetical protein|nr:hypothetical protein [Prevotellaceae bacterium]
MTEEKAAFRAKTETFRIGLISNKLLLLLSIGLLVTPAVFIILYAPVYCDAAYYLSIVELMSEGHKIYEDITSAYTPLVFYFTLLLKTLFGIGINYRFYLVVNLLILYLCGYFAYKLAHSFTGKKPLAFLASWLFILSAYSRGGDAYLLELPGVLFGLWACVLAIHYGKNTYIFLLTGLIASAAFWSKQYGIGFIPLILILIYFTGEHKYKQISLFILGVAVSFIFMAIALPSVYDNLYNGYGTDAAANDYYDDKVVRNLFWAFDYYIKRICPCLLFAPLIPFFKNNTKKEYGYFIFLLSGFGGFLCQFYFNKGDHYFLYMLPFSSILTALLIKKIADWKPKLMPAYYLVLVIMIIRLVNSVYKNQLYYGYIARNERKEQLILADKIKQHIGRVDASVYIYDIQLISQYYLTGYKPPKVAGKYDFSFGPLFYNEQLIRTKFNVSDYILREDINLNWWHLTPEMDSILSGCEKATLKTNQYNLILYDNTSHHADHFSSFSFPFGQYQSVVGIILPERERELRGGKSPPRFSPLRGLPLPPLRGSAPQRPERQRLNSD